MQTAGARRGRARFIATAARGAWLEGLEDRTLLSLTVVPSQTVGTQSSNPTQVYPAGGTTFFTVSSPSIQLWAANGTGGGVMLKDFGTNASKGPQQLTVANGALYFTFTDASGNELWRSDGTVAGTALLKDINPGSASSSPSLFGAVNGTLYFSADDGVHGRELWQTDGTAAGTALTADIAPGSADPGVAGVTVVNGALYFNATDATHGSEPWVVTPGAAPHLVADINPSSPSGASFFTLLNGVVYFAANDGTHGLQLWSTPLGGAGATLVTLINPGGWSNPASLTAVGNTLLFTATDGAHGTQLWESDGTAAGTVAVATAGPNGPSPLPAGPSGLTAANGALYFLTPDATTGQELWTTDGTAAGTVLLHDFVPAQGATGPAVRSMVAANGADGKVFFTADAGSGPQLWVTDGTAAGTVALPVSAPTSLTAVGNKLLFAASAGPNVGTELWSSDGTAAGTGVAADIDPGPGSSGPAHFAAPNGTLYFAANDGTHGNELWKSDGTAAGTALAVDANASPVTSAPAPLGTAGGVNFVRASGGLYRSDPSAGLVHITSLSPSYYAFLGDALYFTTGDSSADPSLWRSDGTTAGTTLVRDFPAKGFVGSITSLAALNGSLYFQAPVETNPPGIGLWVSDGTAAGTQQLFQGTSGAYPMAAQSLTPVGNKVYFFAANVAGTKPWALWSTDGTSAGTQVVTGISFPPADGLSLALAGPNDTTLLYPDLYSSRDPEPFASDGTPAGSGLITRLAQTAAQFSVGVFDSDPYNPQQILVSFNGYVYWLGPDPLGSKEVLWRTDGTAANTSLVATLGPRDSSGNFDAAYGLTAVANHLLFVVQKGKTGSEFDLWSSDGTPAGTSVIQPFLAPTVTQPTLPPHIPPVGPFVGVNGVAYFGAPTSADGTELWQSDGTAAGTSEVADLNPGSSSSAPSGLANVNGALYFGATTGASGNLYRLVPPTAPPAAPLITSVSADSPFSVTLQWQPGGLDVSSYRIDRSRSSDFSVVDDTFTAPSSAADFTDPVADPGTHFYYRVFARNAAGASAPATVQVTTPPANWPAGAVLASDPNSATNPDYVFAQGLVSVHGSIFFVAYDPATSSHCVYRTDGTTTTKIFTGVNGGLDLVGNTLYFEGPGNTVLQSDGTAAGTRLAPNGFPSSPSPTAGGAMLGNALVTTEYTGSGASFRLVAVDQTTGASTPLASFPVGSYAIPWFYQAYGHVYFVASPANNPAGSASTTALWETDGTAAGTRQLVSLPDSTTSPINATFSGMVSANGTVFFTDGSNLWATDGTAAGTTKLYAFGRSPSVALVSDLTVVNDRLYFALNDPTAQDSNGALIYTGQLWTSDGTVAGTVQVPGLARTQGVTADSPSDITADGDTVYFVGDAGSGPASSLPASQGQVYHFTPAPLTLPVPAAPTRFAATVASAAEVDLTWADNAHNEQGYTLQRSTDPAFGTIGATVTLASDVTRYADLGLSPGTA